MISVSICCLTNYVCRGSHHICIDVSSTSGGNFCTVTGQSDWCSSTMTCDDTTSASSNDGGSSDNDQNSSNTDDDLCPVQNWCVCQWAFASYLQTAGGCDYIQDIQCNATNLQALLAYSNMAGTSKDYDKKYTNALNCIESRCGVSSATLDSYQSVHSGRKGFNDFVSPYFLVVVSICLLLISFKRYGGGSLFSPQRNNDKRVESYQTLD